MLCIQLCIRFIIGIIIIMPFHSPIHAWDALTLATCWCALQPILSAGAHFLVAFTSAIESVYLQEVLCCRWLGHCDRYKTSRRYQPTPPLWREILVYSVCGLTSNKLQQNFFHYYAFLKGILKLNHIKRLPQYILWKDFKNAPICKWAVPITENPIIGQNCIGASKCDK